MAAPDLLIAELRELMRLTDSQDVVDHLPVPGRKRAKKAGASQAPQEKRKFITSYTT